MSKADGYRETLRSLKSDWVPFLLAESCLPGPRGNLELAHVVADEGDEALFKRLLTYDAEIAPVNTPEEFLAFCGAEGTGRLVAEGRLDLLGKLRELASDPRWRMREAVAMGLQRWGMVDMNALLDEMETWSRGNFLERRAAAAAICEPSLLRDKTHVERVLRILDAITASIAEATDRKNDEFQALRKGMAYCWSVAIVAHPEAGKPLLAKWLTSQDKDVLWIVKENLKKERLRRMDAAWVEAMLGRL